MANLMVLNSEPSLELWLPWWSIHQFGSCVSTNHAEFLSVFPEKLIKPASSDEGTFTINPLSSEQKQLQRREVLYTCIIYGKHIPGSQKCLRTQETHQVDLRVQGQTGLV